MWRLFLFAIIILAPLRIFASIEISEVAWMGSEASPNHEWIELSSTGNSVLVDGWILTDGNNLNIALSGIIPAKEYVVLERTNDLSAPGAAFLLYTGALSNSGGTLTLRDATGAVVDRVVGGTDWETIGGNNQTKDTAQLINGTWVTSAPTPGTGLAAVSETAADDQDDDDDTATNTSTNNTNKTYRPSSSDSQPLTLPDVTLQLTIIAPAQVHLGQPVQISVEPSGIGESLMDSLNYIWNFGDGTTDIGKEVTHTFVRPGRYVIVVEGEYKRQRQLARVEIEVLPLTLSMGTDEKGNTTIKNTGDSEIDMSGYRVVANQAHQIPEYTFLLPNQEMFIPSSRTGMKSNGVMIALYNQANQLVASQLPDRFRDQGTLTFAQQTPAATISTTYNRPVPLISAISNSQNYAAISTSQNNQFAFVETDARDATSSVVLSTDSQTAQVIGSEGALPENWPFYSLVGLLLLAITSVFFLPNAKHAEA